VWCRRAIARAAAIRVTVRDRITEVTGTPDTGTAIRRRTATVTRTTHRIAAAIMATRRTHLTAVPSASVSVAVGADTTAAGADTVTKTARCFPPTGPRRDVLC